MSMDLIAIKNALANSAEGLDDDTRAVAGMNGSGGTKRISIKGGVFRKYAGGKEVGAIEDRHMNVIFVKMAHAPSRTFYSQGYQEGVKISPACWSTDSKLPDADVKAPQANSCNSCPNSIEGSGTGGRGKACRLSWRTAVVLPNDPSGDVMQLVLPGGSCWGEEDGGRLPFKPYINKLAANGIRAGRVVTKMQFDTKSPAPKLLFSAIEPVSDHVLDIVQMQGASDAAINAVKLTVFQSAEEVEVARPAVVFEDRAPAEPDASPEFDAAVEAHLAPKLRDAKPASENPDAADVIKRWGKK